MAGDRIRDRQRHRRSPLPSFHPLLGTWFHGIVPGSGPVPVRSSMIEPEHDSRDGQEYFHPFSGQRLYVYSCLYEIALVFLTNPPSFSTLTGGHENAHRKALIGPFWSSQDGTDLLGDRIRDRQAPA